jgi:hypothetical protein
VWVHPFSFALVVLVSRYDSRSFTVAHDEGRFPYSDVYTGLVSELFGARAHMPAHQLVVRPSLLSLRSCSVSPTAILQIASEKGVHATLARVSSNSPESTLTNSHFGNERLAVPGWIPSLKSCRAARSASAIHFSVSEATRAGCLFIIFLLPSFYYVAPFAAQEDAA